MIDGDQIEAFFPQEGHSCVGAFGDFNREAAPVERTLSETAQAVVIIDV
jgi:hypothetical protein